MYSEHGLDAVIRPVSGLVCQSLIVSSYWMPGSAQAQAAWAILPEQRHGRRRFRSPGCLGRRAQPNGHSRLDSSA
jgi:hypothetical protein